MSTVVLDTITGKSTATTVTIGSTPVVSASANSMTIRGEGSVQTSIQQGLAKAFIFTNQITAADSFNMTATTDHGTGTYTNSITNNMGNTNYVGQVNGEWTHGSDSGLAINSGDNNTLTTSAYGCIFYNSSFATYDVDGMAALFHGDLA